MVLKVFYGQEPPSRESTITECGVNYQLLAVIYWSSQMGTPNWGRPQPVTDNSVNDVVDPIDWSHPPPSWAVPTERLVHGINRCSFSSTGNRSCNFSLWGNHLAYAATQGVRREGRALRCGVVGVRCDRERFYVHSPSIEKCMNQVIFFIIILDKACLT